VSSAVSVTVSSVLRSNRNAIAIALIDSVAEWDKYSSEIPDDASRREFSQRETIAFVDYLAALFETGDVMYRNLYIGEKLKQCYYNNNTPEEAIERRRRITTLDQQAFLSVINSRLDEASAEAFAAQLSYIQDLLTRRADKTCRVLFVGDCLYLDLLGFLTVPLMEAGIQLVPTFVTNKVVSGQHRELHQLQRSDFDLVFYSPLTYAFHQDFSELQLLKPAFSGRSYRRKVVTAAKKDIRATVQLMKGIFECPIFIHNSANIRRHNGSVLESIKTFLTRGARRQARDEINAWLPEYLEDGNSGSGNLFLLDEAALLKTSSEWALSKTLYNATLQHPAYFGCAIAPMYEDIVVSHMILAKKKLIICDLDNTLWDGVIGDGAVEHYVERQKTLLALRNKGLLLAICSKNDPGNVHWRGAALSEDDFVCQQINWDSKSENIRRIARRLNLKTKDFIFVDDRADERALVGTSMPEITILDAQSSRTWSKLSMLASILTENTDGDRTLAYKQRESRERFLSENSRLGDNDFAVDESEALKKLNLELGIRMARRNELARVAELINRTNQFNMNASRTSLHEVNRWHDSDRHVIWVAEARDKFGNMGTISVAVTERTNRGVEIIAFVLSCRVFGYGMENALLNRIKQSFPGVSIFGHFKETPHNGPCHHTYAKNSFSLEGSQWVYRGGRSVPDAEWLAIKDATGLTSSGVEASL